VAVRGLIGAALACALLAWLLLALGNDHAEARLRSELRRERTLAHSAVLRAAGARLGGLEALPPELLARTLAELMSVYPEWSRLMVCDANGRVLAAEPKRDTALVGALDPSEARRRAFSNANPDAIFAQARPGGVELGVAQRGHYIAGDLAEAALTPKLGPVSTPPRVIASWALATVAVLFSVAAGVISSRRRP
jgi:hypothetical protein